MPFLEIMFLRYLLKWILIDLLTLARSVWKSWPSECSIYSASDPSLMFKDGLLTRSGHKFFSVLKMKLVS